MADILTNLDDEECCGQGCSRCLTKGAVEAEVWGGSMDGMRIELCGPLDCRCGGGCDVE